MAVPEVYRGNPYNRWFPAFSYSASRYSYSDSYSGPYSVACIDWLRTPFSLK
jgi:hypothetical protein